MTYPDLTLCHKHVCRLKKINDPQVALSGNAETCNAEVQFYVISQSYQSQT